MPSTSLTSVSKAPVRGPSEEIPRHSAHQLAKGRVQVSSGIRLKEVFLHSQNSTLLCIGDRLPSEPCIRFLGLQGERWISLLVIFIVVIDNRKCKSNQLCVCGGGGCGVGVVGWGLWVNKLPALKKNQTRKEQNKKTN